MKELEERKNNFNVVLFTMSNYFDMWTFPRQKILTWQTFPKKNVQINSSKKNMAKLIQIPIKN